MNDKFLLISDKWNLYRFTRHKPVRYFFVLAFLLPVVSIAKSPLKNPVPPVWDASGMFEVNDADGTSIVILDNVSETEILETNSDKLVIRLTMMHREAGLPVRTECLPLHPFLHKH
jgi:hypothetical protein